jgi:hypothetical protein
MSNVKRKKKMSYETQSDAESKIKLMANFWRILGMCGGACLLTIILSVISSWLAWEDVAILKIFIFVVIFVSGIFSVVTLVTTAISLYFKVTTLDEKAFRDAVGEIAAEIARM